MQVVRDRRTTGRIIRIIPSSVLARGLDLVKTSWPHSTCFDQLECSRDVELRPHTALASRREFLNVGISVIFLGLTVDPAVAERFLERFRIGYRRHVRRFLEKPQPNPVTLVMIGRQPLGPRARGPEGNDFE